MSPFEHFSSDVVSCGHSNSIPLFDKQQRILMGPVSETDNEWIIQNLRNLYSIADDPESSGFVESTDTFPVLA